MKIIIIIKSNKISVVPNAQILTSYKVTKNSVRNALISQNYLFLPLFHIYSFVSVRKLERKPCYCLYVCNIKILYWTATCFCCSMICILLISFYEISTTYLKICYYLQMKNFAGNFIFIPHFQALIHNDTDKQARKIFLIFRC